MPAAGFLNVLMNCQWQSLLCRVEAGVLNMFAEEEEAVQGERSPQYTVQLRGCEVKPDTKHCYRITLSMLDDQMAVLEVSWWNREFEFIHFNLLLNNVSSFLPSFLQVSSSEEKQRWLKLLQDGAAYYCHHDNKTQEHSGVTLRYQVHHLRLKHQLVLVVTCGTATPTPRLWINHNNIYYNKNTECHIRVNQGCQIHNRDNHFIHLKVF